MWAGRVLHAALSAAPLSRRAQSALTQLRGVLEEELEAIRGAGTWKSERVITSRQGPRIHVDGVSGGNWPLLGVVGPGGVFEDPCSRPALEWAEGGWEYLHHVAAGALPSLSG